MFGMSLQLSQRLAFECVLCHELVGEETATAEAVIFGTRFYAYCLGCGCERLNRSVAYRRRWLKRFVELAVSRTVLERARQLIQRDFRPNVRCRAGRTAHEYISYPFVELATDKLMIMVREVDKSWTMRPMEIWQAPPVASEMEAVLEGLLPCSR